MSSWIDDYLEYTKNQESPILFHRWCAISIIASVLNRRVWLDRRGPDGVVHFTTYPGQMSVCLVAGAGRCKKSTAVTIAKRFMKEGGVNVFDGKITPERLLGKLANMPGRAPVMTIVASELSSFLGKQSYNDGLIDNLIKLLDCDNNPYESQKSTYTIINPCLSMLMATTPFSMGKSIPPQAHDTGFLSRHIFVYSDKPGAAQSLSYNEDDIDPTTQIQSNSLRERLVKNLREFTSFNGEFRWTVSGRRWYDDYYNKYRASPVSDAEGYAQRRPEHLTRVAMCVRCSEGTGLFLDKSDLIMSDKLLTEVEQDMSRAFMFIGQHINTEQQERILSVFREKLQSTGIKPPVVSKRDLTFRTMRYFGGNPQELSQQIATLIQAGVLQSMGVRPGTKDEIDYVMIKEPY